LAVLKATELCVQFGAFNALGPVSLEVEAGECVVLLGPSGCGKSTFLAALAGLQTPTSGHVARGEEVPGFVFQDANLMAWASALDNVALPLALAGLEGAKRKALALEALDQVGLAGFARAKPAALSGGMRMRVALARALVSKPSVLLLDEPFAAIDELGRRALDDLVLSAKTSQNLAIVFVTHSVEEAVYLGDRVLVMTPRPGTVAASIEVKAPVRDHAYLLSDDFAQTVSLARRRLAQSLAKSLGEAMS
jgi:NitT/TauT family transport system ATP-binding protein